MAVDHYAKLASNTEAERLQAAVALLDHLIKKDDSKEWDAALARLAKALVSPRQPARLGASMALTELLNERYKMVKVSDYLELLPKLDAAADQAEQKEADNSKKNKKTNNSVNDKYAVLFGVQALINSKVVTYKHTSLDDFKLVSDLLINLVKNRGDDNSLLESAYTSLCLLAKRLPDVSFPQGEAVEYLFQKIHTDINATFTPEAIALYVSVPAALRVSSGSFTGGWAFGDPLAKGNFPALTKALLTTIPDSASANLVKENAWKKKKKGAFDKQKIDQKIQQQLQPPKLNIVWAKIASAYLEAASPAELEESKSKKQKSDKKSKRSSLAGADVERIGFSEFWKGVVDDSFFSQSSTAQKRLIGLEIFEAFLTVFTSPSPSVIPLIKSIFSANLIRVVTASKYEKSTGPVLQKAIKQFGASIVTASKASPVLAAAFLESIFASKSAHNFDLLTKTKTTHELMTLALTPEYLPVLAKFYLDAFITPFPEDPKIAETDPAVVDLRRKWALEKMTLLIKSPVLQKSAPSERDWLDNLIYTLIRVGFFKPVDQSTDSKKDKKESKKRKHDSAAAGESIVPSPPVSEASQALTQEKVSSIIGLTVNLKRPDNATWPHRAISKLVKLESDPSLECLVKFDSADLLQKSKAKALQTLEKIRVKRQSSPHVDGPQLEAFELLFSLVIFQVYTSDTEAGGVLEELQTCYNTVQGQSQTDEVVMGKPGSSGSNSGSSGVEDSEEESDSDEEEEVDVSLVLTEILLSFISRESAALLKVSETVWKTFVPQITRDSLQRLYDVLGAQETADGQSELFDNLEGLEEMGEDYDEDEEEEEDEEEDDEESEEDEDEGKTEKSSTANCSKESKNSDDDEEVTEGTNRDKIEEVEEESRRKLAQALGISADGDVEMKDVKETSEDDEAEDDDEMDDDQMMALDGHLAAIFRERQMALKEHAPTKSAQRKKEAKVARHNMVQFKMRVIDLLGAYVQTKPSSGLVLTMVVPLLNLIKSTRDKNLGEKAVSLLKKDICKIKVSPELVAEIKKDVEFEDDEEDGCEGGCGDGCCAPPAGEDDDAEEEDDESESEKSDSKDKEESPEVEEAEDSDSDDDGFDSEFNITTSDLIEWIQEIHSLAWKSNRLPLTQACNHCSVFIAKVLVTTDFNCLQAVLSVYMASIQDWLSSKRNRLAPAMFNDFLNWAYSFRQQKFGLGASAATAANGTKEAPAKPSENGPTEKDEKPQEKPKGAEKKGSKKPKKTKKN